VSAGESLEKGIQSCYVLSEDEAIVLQAAENFTDKSCTGAKGFSFK